MAKWLVKEVVEQPADHLDRVLGELEAKIKTEREYIKTDKGREVSQEHEARELERELGRVFRLMR